MQDTNNISQPILDTSVSNQVLTVAYETEHEAELARVRLGLAPHRRKGSSLEIPLVPHR